MGDGRHPARSPPTTPAHQALDIVRVFHQRGSGSPRLDPQVTDSATHHGIVRPPPRPLPPTVHPLKDRSGNLHRPNRGHHRDIVVLRQASHYLPIGHGVAHGIGTPNELRRNEQANRIVGTGLHHSLDQLGERLRQEHIVLEYHPVGGVRRGKLETAAVGTPRAGHRARIGVGHDLRLRKVDALEEASPGRVMLDAVGQQHSFLALLRPFGVELALDSLLHLRDDPHLLVVGQASELVSKNILDVDVHPLLEIVP